MLIHPYVHCQRAVVAAILVMSLPAAAQVDVGLSPMRLDIPVEPGRSYSGSVVLTNSGSVRTRVRAELLDFYVDESTTPQFVPRAPSEDAHSCRSWLTANPMEIELEPKSQTPVRYTVRVPPEPPRAATIARSGSALSPTQTQTPELRCGRR